MNQSKNEFSNLNRFLEEDRFEVQESQIRTRKGILKMTEFYFRESDLKKSEIVVDSKRTTNGLVLKLENCLPKKPNSNLPIKSFSIQVFNDDDGLNYGGRITIPHGTYLEDFEQISNDFFDDFRKNSFHIYQQMGDLIYDSNPDSIILDKISLAMTAKLPKQTPNVRIWRI